MGRSINDVLLRRGDDTVSVHGCAITVVKATTGAPLSHTSGITHHRLTVDTVVDVAPSGRGRWQIDTDNTPVLTTKGDHLEHHCGHGKQSLAACMLRRNLLALLFHTVVEWSDDRYALLRRVRARRQTFCHAIQALRRSMVFDHWEHLMDCMIRGLELALQFDSS